MIATLYDVHGNLPALDAVLREIPDEATIVIGGDAVAGPFPSETLERLRGLGERALWIRGNADRELSLGEKGLAPPHFIEWVRARLSNEQIAFLYEQAARIELGDTLYVHATPRNDVDIFTELTPEERLAPYFEREPFSTIVCGHTHMQFERTIAGKRVVNSGSVGMPYEREPGAYWTLDLEFRRTAYEPDLGDYPFEWPSSTREEALAHFESLAV